MSIHFIKAKSKFFEEVIDFLKNIVSAEPKDNFLVPPKKDNRGWLARKIDYLAVRGLFFFMIVFVASTKFSLYSAIAAATAGTLLLHLVLNRSEKAREGRYAANMRDYTVRSYTYDQLMKTDPGSEFKILIAQVLNGLDGFTSVQPCSADDRLYKFDLIGRFKDLPIAVSCNRYKKENEVGKAEIVKFTTQMQKAGLTRGIYFTTSDFSEWAIDYVHSIKKELRIVLVDKVRLLEWIRLSGHSIYPDSIKAEELEAAKRRQDRIVSLQKREKQNKRLMHAFFMVSIYLTGLSLLMRQWLQDWMLYLYFSVAIFNLLLGFLFYFYFKHTRAVIRESYTLEQLD